jgi:predicted dehydrogenase/threonine dehydrogenase-like Zn-dependent dehydrogenase
MKQILQNLKTGETELVDVPCPKIKPGHLLIRTHTSLISAGTERMLVNFGKASFFEKARQQPDKVKQVLDKINSDGLLPTLEAVHNKLDQPVPLGYCNVGTVLEIGKGVEGWTIGDRVVSNGPHAEIVQVPNHLCAKIPNQVSDETAVFTVMGAIALQGIRLLQPTLGEAMVVTGLGLIGQLAVQLLRAQGCRVLGIDFDTTKCQLAQSCGAHTIDLSKGEDPITVAQGFSRGSGVDGVLITASTKSDEPVHQAALMCRKRGRIVLVGVTGLNLSRDDFYKKELSFQVSASYGPGRYDPTYEEGGQDYPIAYVRWTEQRNFEAVLDMMADGKLQVESLISQRFPLERALEAYQWLEHSPSSLGILLQYSPEPEKSLTVLRQPTVFLASRQENRTGDRRKPVVGFIGAGNYASRVLIPAFKTAGVRFKSIATTGGVSGVHQGRKYGFAEATTEVERVLTDPEINTVVIATPHHTHARFVCQALQAGKHIFVEKPLALTTTELEEIDRTYREVYTKGISPLLMVGFNRRFAPQVQKMKTLLESIKSPKAFIVTVNAGEIPPDHWTQQRDVGGGRIIGEGCHFIDLLRFLTGASISSIQAQMIGAASDIAVREDKVTFTLGFADGSFGTVHYLANGHKSFPKERLEVFCQGRILQLDNFRKLWGFGWPGFKKMNLWWQDKGQKTCVKQFVEAILQDQSSPIPFEEVVEVTQASFEVMNNLRY